ncbi:zinc finger protein [Stylonychia lemnae]|uniref:Zinc finger protein n=1 Tax=Stylonychia lemnae TaxID=5949 RepID=A0A078AR62_STYLE|nr:zinc finger protein [Stylonychia lemnae]|eukprot:CDW84456.1 zinc finger protein [Stylonychia lemnae]
METHEQQDAYKENDNQYEIQHLNQKDINEADNGVELAQSSDTQKKNAPMNTNKDSHFDPKSDQPAPNEKQFETNFKNITKRQQSFKEFRRSVYDGPVQPENEYNEAQLLKAKRESVQQCIIYSLSCGIWIGYGVGNRDAVNIKTPDYSCNTPISTWLIVMGATYGLQFIFSYIQMMIVFTKKEKSKHAVQVLNLLHFILITNFQVTWLIYGNTFHYSSNSMMCRKNDKQYQIMWVLMMISISIGYAIFLAYAIISGCCICLCCIIFGKAGKSRQQSDITGKMPFMNAIKILSKKNSKKVEETSKNSNDCTICLAKLQDDQEITELNCEMGHYFHTDCIQNWMKKKPECPLCKKPVEAIKMF